MRPTLAAASARRSFTTPRKRSSPGLAPELGGRSGGRPSGPKSFLSDAHGRDHVTHAEMAFDANGKVLALKAETLANMGAYLSTFAPCVPTWLHGTLLAGQYTTPAVYVNVKAVFTNTVPVDAYRGAGRPEATYHRRTADEQGRAGTGHRPGRAAPAKTSSAEPVPLPDAGRGGLRHRRLRGVAGQGDRARRLRGLREAPGGSQGARASCAASASRPTSKPAASRRRASSVRSARGRASTKRRRCGSTRPAR